MTDRDLWRGMGALWRRVRAFIRRRAFDAELDEEIRAHLDMAEEEYRERGMSPEEARRAARRDFGGVDQVKERQREARGFAGFSDALRDLRFALRGLRRRPGFAIVTVGTVALGIGATSATFSVVNGVLLEPLPFEDPDELVSVLHAAPGWGSAEVLMSAAMYFTYRDESRVFEDIAAWDPEEVSVAGGNEPERLLALRMTGGLLPMLGARPFLGRAIIEADDAPDAPPTVMLSYAYWQRRFGGDPGAIGDRLLVDGLSREIIGVAPPDLVLPGQEEAELIFPFQWDPGNAVRAFNYRAIARLESGATLEQAAADVARMIPLSAERFPGGVPVSVMEEAGFGPNLRPLEQEFVGDVRTTLWVILGTVGIVLLIASANVANLFLVRAEGRRPEIAIRAAIGAGRSRIASQLLIESLVVGLLGGTLGLALAFGGIRWLVSFGPEGLPRLDEIGVTPEVVALSFGVSVVVGIAFGLFPMISGRRSDLAESLKAGGRGSGSGLERSRVLGALVVAQVAMALVLLVGSGLMIRSFQALRHVDPGFANAEQVLTFRVTIPAPEVASATEVAVAYEDIWQRLQDIPGVASVGASSALPMEGGSMNAIWVEDARLDPGQTPPPRRMNWVTGGYFETIQSPVLAGRAIDWSDVRAGAPVAMVTENFAEEQWGSASAAVGQRIATGNPASLTTWREVVGVVGDIHDDGLDQPAPPSVFWPMVVTNLYRTGDVFVQRSMSFAVRTSRRSPSDVLPEVQRAVWAVNPNLPLAGIRTLDEIRDRSLARTSFTLVILGIAAAVALALGVVGIYGVLSYLVSRRSREIGLRMALGAKRSDVSRMVLGRGMGLVAVGVAAGIVAASSLTRLMESLLYGVRPLDPLTFGLVAVLLAGVSLAATYVPARRAAAADPMTVLRRE